MKKALLITTALLSLAIYGESKDITGDWKEVKRMSAKTGTSIAYTDTMFFRFMSGNEYVSQKKGGFIYKGTYKMENNTLDMGARFYTILKHTKTTLKLKDDGGIYEFVMYTPQDGMSKLPDEPKAAPVTDITQMKGHWSEFKRTSDHTIQEIDYQRLIKMMDIFTHFEDGNWGYVFATRDADNNPSWHIDSYDSKSQVLHCSGRDSRDLKVMKCQDNELVLEEKGITYFFRRFKQ
ncbi:MAG: hypothetical protein BGO69_16135 [Bacteroidetes bacterium 46-16]|nr:MAG: hypothetical protein BGO69_16135 [Bacteroidetes bacterium 46-16]